MGGTVDDCISAVQRGDLVAVTEFISVQKVSVNSTDIHGCSLLHWAALNQRYNVAKYLLISGADINVAGGDLGEMPLQWAVRSQYLPICDLLIQYGANLAHKSSAGAFDALHLACHSGNVPIICSLLINGANPDSTNGQMETPLLWILKNSLDSVDIIRLLLQFNANVFAVDANMNNAMHIVLTPRKERMGNQLPLTGCSAVC
jgi:ankyrin repeat protein